MSSTSKPKGAAKSPGKKRSAGAAAVPALPAPSPGAPAAASAATLPARTAAGTFPAGVSGNPRGRQKGTKNHITALRQAHEAALVEYLAEPENMVKAKRSIDRLFDIVATADDREATSAIKVLFGNVLTTTKQDDSSKGGPQQVRVIIDNRVPERAGPPPRIAIEAVDYEEITDDG